MYLLALNTPLDVLLVQSALEKAIEHISYREIVCKMTLCLGHCFLESELEEIEMLRLAGVLRVLEELILQIVDPLL